MLETVLEDLTSEQLETQLNAQSLCVTNDSLLGDRQVITQLFQLLNHENYYIRDEAEKTLEFYIKYSSEPKDHLIKLLLESLNSKGAYNSELWFRYAKLFVSLPVKESSYQYYLIFLKNDSFNAQGFVIFTMRTLCKQYPALLTAILDSLSNLDQIRDENQGNSADQVEHEDLKKAICWLFWQNPDLYTPQFLQALSQLADDENREVRRLACEILSQMITIEEYHSEVVRILQTKIFDDSWRVQKIAAKSLFSSAQRKQLREPGFLSNVLALFWHSEWRVRKNICETLPPLLVLEDQENLTFLETLIASLDDTYWEVREQAMISLNQALNLNEEEHEEVLKKIAGLINDSHEEVRKTGCYIITERFRAFENTEEVFLKILQLLEDSSALVREEAVESISQFLGHPYWGIHVDQIFSNLLKLLIDENERVRDKTWFLLQKVMDNRSLSQNLQFQIVSAVVDVLEHPLSDIRLKGCQFLRNFEKTLYWDSQIPERFHSLLEDEDPAVLACAWPTIMKHRDAFKDLESFVQKRTTVLENLNPTAAKFVCEASSQFGFLSSEFVRGRLIFLLTETKNRELKKAVLQAFLPHQRQHGYLTPGIIKEVLDEGKWDVQETLIPFFLQFLADGDSLIRREFQDVVLALLLDPIMKHRSMSPRTLPSLDDLVKELDSDLSEENLEKLFDNSNDKARFENWIRLEEKLDLIQKMNHPAMDELRDTLEEGLLAQKKKDFSKFGYLEILSQEVGLNTPLKIVEQMRGSLDVLRFRLLSKIESNSSVQWPKFDQIIANSLVSDASLLIRQISWKFLQKRLLSTDELTSDGFQKLLELNDSPYVDIRASALMILLSRVDINDPETPNIRDQALAMLDDHSFLVRCQIWHLIEELNYLSFPIWEPLVENILKLLSYGNPNLRKEATDAVEERFNVFLRFIESSPQPPDVLQIIATSHCQRKEFGKALELFNEIVSKDQVDINSWLGKALTLLYLDESGKTLEALQNALKIDPLDFRIYSIWSKCALNTNRGEAKRLEKISNILKHRKTLLRNLSRMAS
jgi:hypothetical protein